jgi:hypothetical protein
MLRELAVLLGEEGGGLLTLFAFLAALLMFVGLFHYPTRKKQKELEYELRALQAEWEAAKHKGEKRDTYESLPK